jgi:hypothetical protein
MLMKLYIIALLFFGCGSERTKPSVAAVQPVSDTIRVVTYDTLRTIAHDTVRTVAIDTLYSVIYDTIRTVHYDTLFTFVVSSGNQLKEEIQRSVRVQWTDEELQQYDAEVRAGSLSSEALKLLTHNVGVYSTVAASELLSSQRKLLAEMLGVEIDSIERFRWGSYLAPQNNPRTGQLFITAWIRTGQGGKARTMVVTEEGLILDEGAEN